jgi:hypothetical protein
MRHLIFATVLGATMTLSTQAATPRSENKAHYGQGRKNSEYKKDEWEKRGPAHYEARKKDFKHDRWDRRERGDMRHEGRGRNRWENEHRHDQRYRGNQCHHDCRGRK